MLDLFARGVSTNRNRATRRDFLKIGTLGAIGFSLADYFAAKAAGSASKRLGERSAIMICNLGAPSQLDLFDMKPNAPSEIRGPFKPIRTASPGIQISEILPLHARVADKFSLVRSCHHAEVPMHEAGWKLMRPDQIPDDRITLPTRSNKVVVLSSQYHNTLRTNIESALEDFENNKVALHPDESEQAAFQQLTSPRAREACVLSRESAAVRERYGMSRFGQSCLLARRLIEAGVRFVTINTFVSVFDEITWDIHGTKPFSTLADMQNSIAPQYDKAYSALIEDLHARGLLESTLVCNLAEFGRTPRINAAGGRDHWTRCFTCYFAGGGVQGGKVVGRSDAFGAEPVDRPVEPAEIVATIYHSLGLELPAMTATSVSNRPIHELF